MHLRPQATATPELGLPPYFYFLTLLAIRIFHAEAVDVAVLEVGLGGRWDATNLVPSPVVCGITSLGYDHMEVLGHTLTLIAGEKAGIMKRGVPCVTTTQPDEAAAVLEATAQQLRVRRAPPASTHAWVHRSADVELAPLVLAPITRSPCRSPPALTPSPSAPAACAWVLLASTSG